MESQSSFAQFWETSIVYAALYDEREKKEVPVNKVGFWRPSLRLRVRCATPPFSTPPRALQEGEPARPPRAIPNSLLAISRHKCFAGIWRVLEVGEEGRELVCLVPHDRFKPNDGGLAAPAYDLDWTPSGSGPADANLCVCAVGSLQTAPRVRIAPPLTWHTRSTIYAISAVDTVAQRFTADLLVELRLRRVCLEGDDEAGDRALVKHMLDAYGFNDDMVEIMNKIAYSSGPERWTTFDTPSTKLRGLERTLRRARPAPPNPPPSLRAAMRRIRRAADLVSSRAHRPTATAAAALAPRPWQTRATTASRCASAASSRRSTSSSTSRSTRRT